MSTKDTGGQAFPIPLAPGPNGMLHSGEPGMTLRDYFAGQALAGMLSDPTASNGLSARGMALAASYATAAYLHADAMLAERQK